MCAIGSFFLFGGPHEQTAWTSRWHLQPSTNPCLEGSDPTHEPWPRADASDGSHSTAGDYQSAAVHAIVYLKTPRENNRDMSMTGRRLVTSCHRSYTIYTWVRGTGRMQSSFLDKVCLREESYSETFQSIFRGRLRNATVVPSLPDSCCRLYSSVRRLPIAPMSYVYYV